MKAIVFNRSGSLTPLIRSGALTPIIDRVDPLTEIAAAHRCVGQRRQRGHVVIAV